MQETIIDILFLGLLTFLFAAVFLKRPDDRLRSWIAGWICVILHFSAQLWQPAGGLWAAVQASVSVDTLALAGQFFITSSFILRDGRRAAIRLGITVVTPTLLCLSLAANAAAPAWAIVAAVILRLGVAIAIASRKRAHRSMLTAASTTICGLSAICSLCGIAAGQRALVVVALLAEIYLIAALNMWYSEWKRTVALYTTVIGLIAWGAVFPATYLLGVFLPRLSIDNDFWTLPKQCVAVGMILVLLEEEIRSARALGEEYRLLFDDHPHPMWIFDSATFEFLDVNLAALELHGYTRDEFLRLKLPNILHTDVVETAVSQAASPEPIPNRASRHLRKDGRTVPMDITASSIVFQGRKCRFVMALDVTEREELAQKLIDQAQHDPLTGLPNRLHFPELLEEAIERAAATQEKVAVVCLDIVRFKHINDAYGPRTGDECIRRIAAELRSRLRAGDSVCRTAGDEFTLVLTGLRSVAGVERAIIDLRESLSHAWLADGYTIQLSWSMGLAVCPDDAGEMAALWRGAESALRRAQAAGGGQTVWLSPELRRDTEESVEIEAYLRKALGEGTFRLVYQPIYGFDKRMRGAEALLRLDHPQNGEISPAVFIPIAEETGLVVPIGDWVIEQVCRQLAQWREQGMTMVPIAVNISTLQLTHVDFAGRLMETLSRYDTDPEWIHLEVTETAAMRNLSEVSEQMADLSALGIKFSLDDFGTGHSSLGRLHQLRISVLKIDRSFIKELCLRSGTYSIVQAILSMAHTQGQVVVAEGVETEKQLACLRELKCDLLQGFLLSRPVAPERIPEMALSGTSVFDQAVHAECCSSIQQAAM